MAAEEDREDQDAGTKNSIDASIRSVKKAARPVRLTVAAPERAPGSKDRSKKKKGKSGFDRELGMAGKAEKERGDQPAPAQKKKFFGGSAGKAKQGGDKRGSKPGKRT